MDPLSIVSSFFQVPSSWLQWPNILFFIILPFFILMFFFKILLYEKIKIFNNESVSWILAVVFSLIGTFILKAGMIGALIGIAAIIWFKVENIVLRIIIIIVILLILLNLNNIIEWIGKIYKI